MKKLLKRVIFFAIGIGGRLSLFLNNRVKDTNWWKNQSLGMEDFMPQPLFRVNYTRNYDALNLGNKRAQCAFAYEKIKGLNLASSGQSLAVDFKVLKFYFSYLKKNGLVIIPIDLFSSVTSNDESLFFYSKFIKEFSENERDIYKDYYTPVSLLLDATQIPRLSYVISYKKYPFIFQPFKSLRKIILDESKDDCLTCLKQTFSDEQLNKKAINWYEVWKKRLSLGKSVSEYLPAHLNRIWNDNRKILEEMVAFCLDRELKVAVVIPPVSKHLAELMSINVSELYINSFVEGLEAENVGVFNYCKVQELQSSGLYAGITCLNRMGAREFIGRFVEDCRSRGLL